MSDFQNKYPCGFMATSGTNLLDGSGSYTGQDFYVSSYCNICSLDLISTNAERTYKLQKYSGGTYINEATLIAGEEIQVEVAAGSRLRFVVTGGTAGDKMFSYAVGLRNDQTDHSSSSSVASFSSSSSSSKSSQSSSSSSEGLTESSQSSSSSSEYYSTGWGINTVASATPVTTGSGLISMANIAGNFAIAYIDNTSKNLYYSILYNGIWSTFRVDSSYSNTSYVPLKIVLLEANSAPIILCMTTYSSSRYIKCYRSSNSLGTSSWATYSVVSSLSTNFVNMSACIVSGRPSFSLFQNIVTSAPISYLRASDSSGATWGSPSSIGIFSLSGTTQTEISMSVINGNPAIAILSGTQCLFFRSSSVDGSGTWAKYTVSSTVGSTVPGISLCQITGYPAISLIDYINKKVYYTKGSDASGTTWEALTVIDSFVTGSSSSYQPTLALIDSVPSIAYYDAENTNLKFVRAKNILGTVWGTPVIVNSGNVTNAATPMLSIGGVTGIAHVVDGKLQVAYKGALPEESSSSSSSSYSSSSGSSPSSQSSASSSSSSSSSYSSSSSSIRFTSSSSSSSSILFKYIQEEIAPDTSSSLYFGRSVAVSDTRIVVGSAKTKAYVYDFDDNTNQWTFSSYLIPTFSGVSDYFGYSISLYGNRIAVGCPTADTHGKTDNGAVYIFDFDGTNWVNTFRLTESAKQSNNRFGHSVSLYGDRLAVGCPYVSGGDGGRVYIFDYSAGSWTETTYIAGASHSTGRFGSSVSLYSSTYPRLAIGEPYGNPSPEIAGHVTTEGCVYIYKYVSGSWIKANKLVSSANTAVNGFGTSVNLASISRVIVGHPNYSSAYVFDTSGITWTETQIISSSARFGYAVSGSSNLFVAGDYAFDSSKGAAYSYGWTGSTWNLLQTITSSDSGGNLGYSISTDGLTTVIGEPGYNSSSGKIKIFRNRTYELSSSEIEQSSSTVSTSSSSSTEVSETSSSSYSSSSSSSYSSSSSSSLFAGFETPYIDMYASYLTAYWSLNETTGNRLDTCNNNDLSALNMSYDTGKNGNAASFNGSTSYLYRSSDEHLSPTTSMAVSLWVNFSDLTGASGNIVVLDRNSYTIYYNTDLSNKLCFYLQQSNLDGIDIINVTAPGGAAITTGTWYNLVLIAEQGNVYAYVNGEQRGTSTYNNTISTISSSFMLGRRAYVSDAYFSGLIDEVGFWKNITFSDATARNNFVSALYNSGNGKFYTNASVSTSSSSSVIVPSSWQTSNMAVFGIPQIISRPLRISTSSHALAWADSSGNIFYTVYSSGGYHSFSVALAQGTIYSLDVSSFSSCPIIAFSTVNSIKVCKANDTGGETWGTVEALESPVIAKVSLGASTSSGIIHVICNTYYASGNYQRVKAFYRYYSGINYSGPWSEILIAATNPNVAPTISTLDHIYAISSTTYIYFVCYLMNSIYRYIYSYYGVGSSWWNQSNTNLAVVPYGGYEISIAGSSGYNVFVRYGTSLIRCNFNNLASYTTAGTGSYIQGISDNTGTGTYWFYKNSGTTYITNGSVTYSVATDAVQSVLITSVLSDYKAYLPISNKLGYYINSGFGSFISIPPARRSSNILNINREPSMLCQTEKTYGMDIKLIRSDSANSCFQFYSVWSSSATEDYSSDLVLTPDNLPLVCFSNYSSLCYVKASNISGSSWESGIAIYSDMSLCMINKQPAVAFITDSSLYYTRAINGSGTAWEKSPVLVTTASSSDKLYLLEVQSKPLIFYYSFSSGDLKLARFDGDEWIISTIDSSGDVGNYCSAIIFKNYVWIAYYDATNKCLKCVKSTSVDGSTWDSPIIIDNTTSADLGQYCRIIEYDGYPVVFYYDAINLNLMCARISFETYADNKAVKRIVSSSGDVGKYISCGVVDGQLSVASQVNNLVYNCFTSGELYTISSSSSSSTPAGESSSSSSSALGGFNSSYINKMKNYLVSYWNLDEAASTTTLTDTKVACNLTDNNTRSVVQGISSQAISLTSTTKNYLDRVSVSYTATTGIMLSAWGRISSASNNLNIFEVTKLGSYYIELFYDGTNNTFEFWVRQLDGTTKKAILSNASTYFTTNAFHHICAIAESGNIYLYIDGVERATTTYDNTLSAFTTVQLKVGLRGEEIFSDGYIDEIGMWLNATFASSSERNAFVSALYNSGKGDFYSK